MTDKIKKQIMAVRALGKTNMCDCNAVQVVANEFMSLSFTLRNIEKIIFTSF